MIRQATDADLKAILTIQRDAFGEEDEAELVRKILDDASAQPTLSLLAFDDDGLPIGHILFSKAHVDGANAFLLAPLAVIPEYHYKGTGQRLMKEGLKLLKENGTDLVFVLGPPDYYPRAGFKNNAKKLGFAPPNPIPRQYDDAWMVINLTGTQATGQVRVCDAISAQEYWSA
ncbi:GNAT family N-acetyltransferase [Terasakiella pusilla]|uniref:GNAT family N-acetyltransferase n=1 Tax=Terasakiella pusilla TaxID=64973 RepID=UPI003AA95172